MGMCCWMGSYFHDWIDYIGFAQIPLIWPLWIWAPLMIIPPALNRKLAFWAWGGGYYFIYLFIYSYKYYILLYIFYITTSYIRLQLIYIQFEKKIQTVEPPFNKPLYNKILSITNYFLQPSQKLQENVWNRTLTKSDLMKSTVSGEETLESQGLDMEVPHDLVIMDWNYLGLGAARYNRLSQFL